MEVRLGRQICQLRNGEKTTDRREFIAAAGAMGVAATASLAFAQMGEEPMHPPKYKAHEEAASHCVATGNDYLRHCLGTYAMKDTSMSGRADAAYQVVVACGALQALAAVNSPHVAVVSKGRAYQAEREKFPHVANAKPVAKRVRPPPRNALGLPWC